MAQAQRAARPRTPPSRRAAAPPKPRLVKGAHPPIRWDRVGRVALLAVLVGIGILYVGPAIGYVQTLREAGHRRAEVRQLEQENTRLRQRRAALRNPATLEREARRLGFVKPGERPYIVKDLPGDK
jgi:cell division protein FtsB